jgi:3-oxoacyl-[acyl-carrier protein] reductase
VGALGNVSDFASLAVWLLSPVSRYITGQTISVDGGSLKTIFG